MFPHDTVIAIFNPLRVDDLRPEARSCIGEVGAWHAGWTCGHDERYPDMPAMLVCWWPTWEQRQFRGIGWVGLFELAVCEMPEEMLDAVSAEFRCRYWRRKLAAEIQAIRLRAAGG